MKALTRLAACSLLMISAPLPAAMFEFDGTASALDSGEELYIEQHRVEGRCTGDRFVPETHRVEYRRSAAEQPFADKVLEYNHSPSRPTVDFRQPEFSERLEITYPADGELEIVWQKPSGETEPSGLRFGKTLVVDAGFDHFVRANWAAVSQGDSVEFDFLAPTRGEAYGFVVEPGPEDQLDADIVVQIRPTSLFLRVLVDPIVLGYNSKGALTHYRGLTNIRKDIDSNYTAEIRYQVSRYPECELTD